MLAEQRQGAFDDLVDREVAGIDDGGPDALEKRLAPGRLGGQEVGRDFAIDWSVVVLRRESVAEDSGSGTKPDDSDVWLGHR